MATKLDKTITREITLDGRPFTVTMGPEGVSVTPKRARNRVIVGWAAIYTAAEKEAPAHGE